MTTRTITWSIRKLSFAGRAQLVNHVLLSINIYWSQIFILPIAVINKINSICRCFLWSGKENDLKGGYIEWDQVYLPNNYRGLSFRDVIQWNKAVVGKLIWHIGINKDDLWVKWIHVVYIKSQSWWDFKASTSASWVVKYICKIKDELKHWNIQAQDSSKQYKIHGVYTMMKGAGTRVNWDTGVQNIMSIPKHKFIMWLSIQQRLQTKSRLYSMGVSQDDLCCICVQQEQNHDHVFFQLSLQSTTDADYNQLD